MLENIRMIQIIRIKLLLEWLKLLEWFYFFKKHFLKEEVKFLGISWHSLGQTF